MSRAPELNATLNTVKQPVVRVTLQDYSSLGGPMGTERTSVLATYDFNDSIVAVKFLEDVLLPAIGIKPDANGDFRDLSASKLLSCYIRDGKSSADLGAYGISIGWTESTVIIGYSVVKDVPQTVNVGS